MAATEFATNLQARRNHAIVIPKKLGWFDT